MQHKNHKICIINGEITWEMVGAAIADIYNFIATKPSPSKIIVPILSPGGDTDAAWSLYSALSSLNSEIITLANGRVYSAAIIPYLAGTRRYALKDSFFLFHPTTICSPENEERPIYKYKEELLGEKKDRLIFKEYLSKLCTHASKATINRLVHESKSTFISAEKALEYGLVTKILSKLNDLEKEA